MIEIQKQTTNPEEWESLLFVLKAVSDDGTRPYLSVLHIEKSKTATTMVATDGKRLHTATVSLGDIIDSCGRDRKRTFIHGKVL
ncbi:MAG: hypothetical protein A2087_09345 [Spirochaetes bacterium GWD1_61_31]|nr:MAG: hypothetical protein A2087_09345 [Spirochaetes bacterium GWD1_61_31]